MQLKSHHFSCYRDLIKVSKMFKAILFLALVASPALANPVLIQRADYENMKKDLNEMFNGVSSLAETLYQLANDDNKPITAASFNIKVNSVHSNMIGEIRIANANAFNYVLKIEDVERLATALEGYLKNGLSSTATEMSLFSELTRQTILNNLYQEIDHVVFLLEDIMQSFFTKTGTQQQAIKESLQKLISLKQNTA